MRRITILVAVVLFVLLVYGPLVSTIPSFNSVSPAQQSANPFNSQKLSAVPGTAPTLASNGQYNIVPAPQAFNASTQILVTMALKPGADLSSALNSVSNPASPNYHSFLSSYMLANEFGVSPSEYTSIVSYFEQFGISVSQSSLRLSMTLSGTPAQLDAAFHTNIQAFYEQYESNGMWNAIFGEGSGVPGSVNQILFYANTEPIYLPDGISNVISGITGFDGAFASPSVMMPKNMYPTFNYTQYLLQSSATNRSNPLLNDPSISNAQALYYKSGYYTWLTIGGFLCTFFGIECTPAQQFYPGTMPALTGAYNLWNGTTTINSEPDTGQGITVAVVEVGGMDPSVLQQFGQIVFHDPGQVLNRVTQVCIPGPTTFINIQSPGGCILNGEIFGWTLETDLDVEYIAAMAPSAHIDIVAVPSPLFAAFDMAYPFIGQFLTTGNCGSFPAGTVVIQGNNFNTGQVPGQGACSVTITSNSYGSGQTYTAYFGSPMYLTVANEELSALALQGVTNFFASGDSGAFFVNLESFFPASSNGVTAVGGGSLVAEDDGQAFPNTGVSTTICEFEFAGICFAGFVATVANTTGLQSYTYWSYGEGTTGTLQGVVGGGFGSSNTQTQPWWQNALDTYNSGTRIIPVVSGSADFQMTIFDSDFGGWQLFFGGTSFATPIQAGEWALIEEQALQAYNNPKLGDINALLFSVHNAFEAGELAINPYIPMQNVGTGTNAFMSNGPENFYDAYFLGLAYMYPQDQNLPWWFATLENPQGSGWNYLQGLGMTNVALLDQAIIGALPTSHYSLVNPAYSVVLASSMSSFETLIGGQTYTFQVMNPDGSLASNLNIQAYSGGTYTQAGASFIPGTLTTMSTSSGSFSYTPLYTAPSTQTGASEYGYFVISSAAGSGPSKLQTFIQFAVEQPPLNPAQNALTVGIETPYGLVTSGSAQVTMFEQWDAQGFYQLGARAVVLLNGQPVADALVNQTAVNVDYQIEDPFQPLSTFAPGVLIGQWTTDLRGQFNVWTNAFVAEANGPLPTQIYTVQASYDGLVSNPVTVYVEPQAGLFLPNLQLNAAGNAIVGNVSFSQMRYVNSITIAVGSQAGQSVTQTYPIVSTDPNGNRLPISGVFEDTIPVDITNLPPATSPLVVQMTAVGANDLSFQECFNFFGSQFCFTIPSTQNPIVWQLTMPVDPAVQLSTTAKGGLANGVINLNFQGIGGTGTLTLSSTGSTQTLASGNSGTFSLNTASLPDGLYVATYTVLGAEGTSTSSTAAFFVDNSMLSQMSSLNSEISSLQQLVSQLYTTSSSANAQIAQLKSQIASLQLEVQSLQQSNVASTATIASLNTQIAQYSQEIQNLKAQLANQSHSAPFGVIVAALGSIGVVTVLGIIAYSRLPVNVSAAGTSSRSWFFRRKHGA